MREPGHRGLGRGLSAFVWLLPIHIFVMAFLFGGLGWPGATVRVIAAWKELLVAALFGLTLVRLAWHRGPPPTVHWLDLAVGGLGVLAFGYLIGASVWFDAGLPIGAQLYGVRDAAFVSLLYFVGRATPEVAEDPRFLRALFLVGVITSVIAIFERLFITPEQLVVLGAARYVQQFLGAVVLTEGNPYGLTSNYWTQFGSHLVQRAGSTYLSAQGFAIPFLLILPAATLWILAPVRRHALAWLGYGVVWIGLVLTITRMTIVACVLQTLVIAGLRRRWSVAVTLGFACVGGLTLALLVVPGLPTYVWETLTWQTGSSVSHLDDWSEAMENLFRYPLGAGLGSTDMVAARFGLTPLAADNQYLKFALELGIVGLILHVAILFGSATAGMQAFLHGRSETTRSYGLLVVAVTLGIGVNAMTAGVFNSMLLAYVFFWLVGSVATVASTARAAPVRS